MAWSVIDPAGGAGGVTVITGTANQITASAPTGAVTLSGVPLIISGSLSASAWTTNGVLIKGTPATLTTFVASQRRSCLPCRSWRGSKEPSMVTRRPHS